MRRVSRKSPGEGRPNRPANRDDRRNIDKTLRQWAVVSARVSQLKGLAEELRVELLTHAEAYGEETGDKGHRAVDLVESFEIPGGETFSGFTREKRVSRKVIIERVESLGKKKGLTNRFFRQETITVLDEDELYACHQEGLISDEELASLIDSSETYALKVW